MVGDSEGSFKSLGSIKSINTKNKVYPPFCRKIKHLVFSNNLTKTLFTAVIGQVS